MQPIQQLLRIHFGDGQVRSIGARIADQRRAVFALQCARSAVDERVERVEHLNVDRVGRVGRRRRLMPVVALLVEEQRRFASRADQQQRVLAARRVEPLCKVRIGAERRRLIVEKIILSCARCDHGGIEPVRGERRFPALLDGGDVFGIAGHGTRDSSGGSGRMH